MTESASKIHLPPLALIFDCDGTLADTMPLHYEAWERTMGEHDIPFPEDRFYSLGGRPSHSIVALLAEEHGKTLDAMAVAELKEQRFVEQLDRVQAIEPVAQIAREQFGNMPMAVASGGTRLVVSRILEQLGISQLFNCVVTAEDTEKHKPEPDVFLFAAQQLNIAPERCLVYEDADLGVEAARRAGMQCIDIRLCD
ncbi:Fructose-1-phosphate phosphatase YqaB [Roseimaritima multifibrata]|uniref:Fructose-1-phosphate phosphatase YqaB n=1 Tax=Roseimaritima multifibrata TaxID=1930274 RepID=A0A517MC10_9BACT|nr:beta-phosphoglucomutase family hydrolase [Roseimaritima multifibrata]QDS92412.1 Fructose-1-phosphate phosphatase YqaB [Roseimaritima multifibrata]